MHDTQFGYPRPQLQRKEWVSLNGDWDFYIDIKGTIQSEKDVPWNARIVVPFSPETKASGIGEQGFYHAVWYRRNFKKELLRPDQRLILHFGAVDYQATVWINGQYAESHEGGYSSFSMDITDLLNNDEMQTIIVLAHDDPSDLEKPRGKQDWQLLPHSIWYPRTTGIWQTVWLESVPETRLRHVSWSPSLEQWALGLKACVEGAEKIEEGLTLKLTLFCKGKVLAEDNYLVSSGEVHRRIALSDPGVDDFRNEFLWSPESPTLIEGELVLMTSSGKVIDQVLTYTALRAITSEADRFMLNGRPYFLRLVLDQGYWPETGITGDEASFRKDIDLIKAMGFNGVRKHQKVEDPRFLYWADHLGLVVFEEMPSAYRFTQKAVRRVIREWADVIERDFSHPCIVAWVPINESWGVPNLPQNLVERHYVQALYHLTKTFDQTRPVVGNDGWESVATDIIGIHDYDSSPERIRQRYQGDKLLPHLLRQERPGGRLLILGENAHKGHGIILSEFGGIALKSEHKEQWGYTRCSSPEEFEKKFTELLEVVRSISIMTGFCYTQFADTYQEANGLVDEKRNPKFALAKIRSAVLGHTGKRVGDDGETHPHEV